MDTERDREEWTDEDERNPEGAEEVELQEETREREGDEGEVETVLNFREEDGEEG
jgi:hypothetical protein